MNRHESRGLTLIELMITLVIISILAAVAYPSYTSYVERSRRADGKAALLEAAARMERCYTQNGTYVGCMTLPIASPDGFYNITAGPVATPTSQLTATTFTLSAFPTGVQARDTRCGTFTLNHLGVRTATGTQGTDDCW